jgi:hypothetical protein
MTKITFSLWVLCLGVAVISFFDGAIFPNPFVRFLFNGLMGAGAGMAYAKWLMKKMGEDLTWGEMTTNMVEGLKFIFKGGRK